MDIARRNDLFVIWIWEEVGDVLWTRELNERRRITFREQDELLYGVMRRCNVQRVAMDQTGMGEKPVEDAQARWGSYVVEGVLLNGNRRLDMRSAAGTRCRRSTGRCRRTSNEPMPASWPPRCAAT